MKSNLITPEREINPPEDKELDYDKIECEECIDGYQPNGKLCNRCKGNAYLYPEDDID